MAPSGSCRTVSLRALLASFHGSASLPLSACRRCGGFLRTRRGALLRDALLRDALLRDALLRDALLQVALHVRSAPYAGGRTGCATRRSRCSTSSALGGQPGAVPTYEPPVLLRHGRPQSSRPPSTAAKRIGVPQFEFASKMHSVSSHCAGSEATECFQSTFRVLVSCSTQYGKPLSPTFLYDFVLQCQPAFTLSKTTLSCAKQL